MKKEKIAVIDLGTNTFHLLIAEKNGSGINILLDQKIAVKIGQGGISKNLISSEAYERALQTLLLFREIMDKHQVTEIHAIATSAVRNARNGYAFVKDIKEKTGIEIKIIDGEKEAELIYGGVKSALDLGKNKSIIVDIGGGSVEFIICNQELIFWKQSFEIGAQRLLDLFHRTDPISTLEKQELVNYLEEKLAPLFEASTKHCPLTLIGSSGTFDTLCDIDVLNKGLNFKIEEEKKYTLALPDFEKIALDIIHKNKAERMKIPGMAEMRVDMIVVACILIEHVVQKLNIQKLRVSACALKEGVLSKVINGEII